MPPAYRYALYFAPPGAWRSAGNAWLGRCPETGAAIAPAPGSDPRQPDWMNDPRHYGLHATLKPPFRLAAGFTEADLMCALPAFAARHPAVPLGNLVVRNVGSFIALVPEEPRPQLDRFAQACVEEFDRFRAPPTPPERARRINAVMLMCGHYDGSGEFAYRVGLPGKSGVGGGILAIAPGKASIAVWSPGLDANGNSHLGRVALEELTKRMGWSVFGA